MRRITAIGLIVLGALLIGWDIYAYLAGGSAATISVVISDFCCRHPWALLVIGFLGGHIWPVKSRAINQCDGGK